MHSHFLQQACRVAQTRRGYCAPNPAVGALLVRDHHVLAIGVTQDPGFDHAEVNAIKNAAGIDLSGSTLYVTLEPCCHFGKTPPCTDAIINAGIGRVYYGYKDPNPIVNGGGALALQAAGIPCEYHPLPQIDEFYQSYQYWVRTRRPWVSAKLAMSLDAKIADLNGQPLCITSTDAKQLTFEHRRRSDAILTTARTIISDNPQLTIRKENCPVEQRSIYILDRQLLVPQTSFILANSPKITVFYSAKNSRLSSDKGHDHIRYVAIDEDRSLLNLNQVLAVIGADGVHDLWVEAGSQLYTALLDQNLVHRALLYIAPKVVGEGLLAFNRECDWTVGSKSITWSQEGPDAVLDVRFTTELCQLGGEINV